MNFFYFNKKSFIFFFDLFISVQVNKIINTFQIYKHFLKKEDINKNN